MDALTHSAPLLQALLATSPDMITVSDRAGRIIYASPATERVSGYTVTEFMARHPFEHIHPDDRPRCEAAFARLLATPGLSLDLHHRILHKDGTWHWVEGTFTSLFHDPTVNGLVAIIRNITEHKRTEAALAEQARLLDLSNDAIIVRDTDNRITYWNHGATELYGWIRDEAVGQDLHTLLRTEFDVPFEELMATLQQYGRMEGEVVQMARDGRRLTMFCRWSLDQDTGAILTTYNDITARTQAEAALRESEAQFRLMADAVPQIVWLTDSEGRTEFFNKQWSDYTGVPYEPTTAAEVAANFVHPDDAAMTMAAFTEAQRAGNTFAVEHRIRSATGAYRWFLVRAEPYRDEQTGEIIRWFGASIDIHDRKRAEAELRASEEMFRAIVNQTSAGICHANLSGTFTFVNHTFCTMLGYDAADLIGMTIWDVTHADDLPQNRHVFEQVRMDGTSFEFEKRLIRKDQSILWVNVSVTAIRDHDGDPHAVIAVVLDISARKQAEAQLRASEARFQAVANLVPDLLSSNDARGWTDWYNQGWLDYTGQTLEQALGYGWRDAIHPDDRDTSVRNFQIAVARGEPLRQEHRIRGVDGTYRWFLVQARPIHDEAGQIVRWYGAATDIHQERIALEAAQAARAEAEAALQIRDHFLAVASHELRTPLTSLMGYAYKLRRNVERGTGDLEPLTDKLIEHTHRLNDLIEQLLNVTRLQRGYIVLERQHVDLVPLTAQVVDEVRTTLPSQPRHTLTLAHPDRPVLVDGDVTWLEQVVHNLLSNAIKYSPTGGQIHVRVGQRTTEAVVEVTDVGMGIPAEAQAQLFDPFYRARNVESQHISGFGLGLHIVKEIVERHGGRIEVVSTEGAGSTFRVMLPRLAPTR